MQQTNFNKKCDCLHSSDFEQLKIIYYKFGTVDDTLSKVFVSSLLLSSELYLYWQFSDFIFRIGIHTCDAGFVSMSSFFIGFFGYNLRYVW